VCHTALSWISDRGRDIRQGRKDRKRQRSEIRGHPGEIRCAVTASISLGREVGDQKSEVGNQRSVVNYQLLIANC
jgi:hypothetical protein